MVCAPLQVFIHGVQYLVLLPLAGLASDMMSEMDGGSIQKAVGGIIPIRYPLYHQLIGRVLMRFDIPRAIRLRAGLHTVAFATPWGSNVRGTLAHYSILAGDLVPKV